MRLRMASDVPLGAFLSGGVDSFAVVAMMARIGGGTVKTFSKRVLGKKINETRYARMVGSATRWSTKNWLRNPMLLRCCRVSSGITANPLPTPSAMPTYCLSQVARRTVTVALNVDGGDECFIGRCTVFPGSIGSRKLVRRGSNACSL